MLVEEVAGHKTYTGQYSNMSEFGLMYYNARWYDPALGRFVQADTIVPQPGDVRGWDRYAYVQGNPLRYADPSGHRVDQLHKPHLVDADRFDWDATHVRLDRTPRPETGCGAYIYSVYIEFVRKGDWKKWKDAPNDPFLAFVGYILGREGYPEVVGSEYEGLFIATASGWFVKWSENVWGGAIFGEIYNKRDVQIMIFNWLGESMQSAKVRIETFDNMFSANKEEFEKSTRLGIQAATAVSNMNQRDPMIENGNSWPSWASQSLLIGIQIDGVEKVGGGNNPMWLLTDYATLFL